MTVGAGWSPRKWLILRFHWRTMLDTERAPDSASEEVVLADTSAPESSIGGFGAARPATRSDMGLASRLSADTWVWGGRRKGPGEPGACSHTDRASLGPRQGDQLLWAGLGLGRKKARGSLM